MKSKKNIKWISVIIFILVCFIGMGVHYFISRSKRALEAKIIAMNGMNVNLSFDSVEAYHDGIDSVYVPSNAKKFVMYVDSVSCSGCFLSHLLGYYEINDSLRDHKRDACGASSTKRRRG